MFFCVKSRALPSVVICMLLLALVAPVGAGALGKRTSEIRKIEHLRRVTWYRQKVIGVKPTPVTGAELNTVGVVSRRRLLRLWRHRAAQIRRRLAHVPRKAQWLCIHHGEGAWSSNTGNGYYGGLQMDLTFQRQYGAFLLRWKGTADRWTPIEQMWVAEHAYESGRGFHPWPNTARACGLIH